MLAKYIILSLLTIQVANSEVIKMDETEIQDLLFKFMVIIANSATANKDAQSVFNETSSSHLINSQYFADFIQYMYIGFANEAGELEGEWLKKCFTDYQPDVTQALDNMLNDTKQCIAKTAEFAVDIEKHSATARNSAKIVAAILNKDWKECNDQNCRDNVLETGNIWLNEASEDLEVLREETKTFLDDGISEMDACVTITTTAKIVQDLIDIFMNKIVECVKEINP